MEITENSNESKTGQRPTVLTIVCILTFISAGLTCLSSLVTPPYSEVMVEMIQTFPGIDEEMKPDLITLYRAGWGYYLPTFLLSVGSLIGAILMWNLKKIGFHFYALSNLGLLFIPMLVLGVAISLGNVLFTAIFITLYAVHLKEMN